MKILSAKEVSALDAYTIKNEPILSINLMERAAKVCTNWIVKNFKPSKHIKIFVGPGNNGGDGLALARMLTEKGFMVKVFMKGEKGSDDAQINYERIKAQGRVIITDISNELNFPELRKSDLVIDALFGSGLTRPIEGFYAQLIKHINKNKSAVLSIDIPSGFFAEDNSKISKTNKGTYLNAVQAKWTLTLELPFLSFFFPDAEAHVGDWHCLSIGLSKDYLNELKTSNEYVTRDYAKRLLKKRNKFGHKGTYGHALLIAGGYGKMGAAILAARACLRTGVGLLTAHFPISGYEIMQTAVPEAMVCIDESGTRFCKSEEQDLYQAIGIGPGIGQKKATLNSLIGILNNAKKPVVIDADGLNLLSQNKDLYDLIPKNSILTPHPGEFRRLVGETNNYYAEHQRQIELAKKHKVIVILKGAHSSIATPDGKCYFNSTGNAGMATAGSGDVLTGILTSFLAQGYEPEKAAILGVYLHGLAGDLVVKKNGMEALIASDIVEHLGKAFIKLKQ